MSNLVQKSAQMISPDAYPQMMGKQQGARAVQSLRSAQTLDRAANVMEASVQQLKIAILDYVAEMEGAGADMRKLYDKAHEIRGFAATAGLVTTGLIADILCRYMDDMERMGQALDAHLVALHVNTIARAARTKGDDAKLGEQVVAEMAEMVARKLALIPR